MSGFCYKGISIIESGIRTNPVFAATSHLHDSWWILQHPDRLIVFITFPPITFCFLLFPAFLLRWCFRFIFRLCVAYFAQRYTLVKNIFFDIRAWDFRVTFDAGRSCEGTVALKHPSYSGERFQRIDVLCIVLAYVTKVDSVSWHSWK